MRKADVALAENLAVYYEREQEYEVYVKQVEESLVRKRNSDMIRDVEKEHSLREKESVDKMDRVALVTDEIVDRGENMY